MRCADCGQPVHVARNVTCDDCGETQIYFHDSLADSAFCLGSGPHVRGVQG